MRHVGAKMPSSGQGRRLLCGGLRARYGSSRLKGALGLSLSVTCVVSRVHLSQPGPHGTCRVRAGRWRPPDGRSRGSKPFVTQMYDILAQRAYYVLDSGPGAHHGTQGRHRAGTVQYQGGTQRHRDTGASARFSGWKFTYGSGWKFTYGRDRARHGASAVCSLLCGREASAMEGLMEDTDAHATRHAAVPYTPATWSDVPPFRRSHNTMISKIGASSSPASETTLERMPKRSGPPAPGSKGAYGGAGGNEGGKGEYGGSAGRGAILPSGTTGGDGGDGSRCAATMPTKAKK